MTPRGSWPGFGRAPPRRQLPLVVHTVTGLPAGGLLRRCSASDFDEWTVWRCRRPPVPEGTHHWCRNFEGERSPKASDPAGALA